jgi:hypothetical protein
MLLWQQQRYSRCWIAGHCRSVRLNRAVNVAATAYSAQLGALTLGAISQWPPAAVGPYASLPVHACPFINVRAGVLPNTTASQDHALSRSGPPLQQQVWAAGPVAHDESPPGAYPGPNDQICMLYSCAHIRQAHQLPAFMQIAAQNGPAETHRPADVTAQHSAARHGQHSAARHGQHRRLTVQPAGAACLSLGL